MGHDIKLTASDQFQLGGYRAEPGYRAESGGGRDSGNIRRQSPHSWRVRSPAREGYAAIAPSIFDRVEPNFQSGYSPDEVAVARKFVANPDRAAILRDTQAAIDAVKDVGPVGIIGFCLGGSVAYAAATKLADLSAAIGYYGGAVVRFADEKPKVPTQLHFGEKGRQHSACGCRGHPRQAARRRDSRLSGRAARISLRRACKLRQSERRDRLAAQYGFFREALAEIILRRHSGMVGTTRPGISRSRVRYRALSDKRLCACAKMTKSLRDFVRTSVRRRGRCRRG